MSSSPINSASSSPRVPLAVAQAAAQNRPQNRQASAGRAANVAAGRPSFGNVADDPRTLREFLRQNPEMATRLQAQVKIATQDPSAKDILQTKLGLSEQGHKNLCRACGVQDKESKKSASNGGIPDPAERTASSSARGQGEGGPNAAMSSARSEGGQRSVAGLMQRVLQALAGPGAGASAGVNNGDS